MGPRSRNVQQAGGWACCWVLRREAELEAELWDNTIVHRGDSCSHGSHKISGRVAKGEAERLSGFPFSQLPSPVNWLLFWQRPEHPSFTKVTLPRS